MPRAKKNIAKKILVIDDDDFLAGIYILTLKKVGYEIILENNGTDGIKTAKKIKPDAIILDVLMPGLDGFQTLRELKTSKETQDIPVIMLTTLSQAEDRTAGLEGGAVAYLTKSTTLPDDVVNELKKIF